MNDISGLFESPMFQLGMNILGNMQWSDRPQSLAGNIGQALQQTMQQQRQRKLLEQEIKDRELRLKAQEQREKEYNFKIQQYENEADRKARIEANRQKILEPLQGSTNPQDWQSAGLLAAQNGDIGLATSLLGRSKYLAESQAPAKPTQWQTDLALDQAMANGTATEEQKRLWELRNPRTTPPEQKWQFERDMAGRFATGKQTQADIEYLRVTNPMAALQFEARLEEQSQASQPAPAPAEPQGESWLGGLQRWITGGEEPKTDTAPAPSANALPNSVWELPEGVLWEDVYKTAETHKMTVEQVLSRIGAKRKGQKSGVSGAW